MNVFSWRWPLGIRKVKRRPLRQLCAESLEPRHLMAGFDDLWTKRIAVESWYGTPSEQIAERTYDRQGRVTEEVLTEPSLSGRETIINRFSYDRQGRLVGATHATGSSPEAIDYVYSLEWQYDAQDRVTVQGWSEDSNGDGQIDRASRYEKHYLTKQADELRWTYYHTTYDEYGEFNYGYEQLITIQYDPRNNPIHGTYWEDYGGDGIPEIVEGFDQVNNRSGQVLLQTVKRDTDGDEQPDAVVATLNRQYDERGNMTWHEATEDYNADCNVDYREASAREFNRDSQLVSRVDTIDEDGDGSIDWTGSQSFNYNDEGLLIAAEADGIQLPFDETQAMIRAEFSYDRHGEMTAGRYEFDSDRDRMVDAIGTGTIESDRQGNFQATFSWDYDNDGSVDFRLIDTMLVGPGMSYVLTSTEDWLADGTFEAFESRAYDRQGRIFSEVVRDGARNWERTWTYSHDSRLITEIRTNDFDGDGQFDLWVTRWTYGAGGRLQSYDYQADFNQDGVIDEFAWAHFDRWGNLLEYYLQAADTNGDGAPDAQRHQRLTYDDSGRLIASYLAFDQNDDGQYDYESSVVYVY